MFRVLIVDDESRHRDYLKYLLKEFPDVESIEEASDGLQAVEIANYFMPHIIFLDINMAGLDGMETAKVILDSPIRPLVVFVSVNREFAIEAFEIDSVDYLTKPFDKLRLAKTMRRVKDRVMIKTMKEETGNSAKPFSKILVKEDGEIKVINICDTIFVEKEQGKKIAIHTINGVFYTNKTLNDMEQELGEHKNFMRCHKSYIINFDKIDTISPWQHSTYIVKFVNYEQKAVISRNHWKVIMEMA